MPPTGFGLEKQDHRHWPRRRQRVPRGAARALAASVAAAAALAAALLVFKGGPAAMPPLPIGSAGVLRRDPPRARRRRRPRILNGQATGEEEATAASAGLQHPPGWADARDRMFDRIPMSTCRFPKFYYRNMKYQDIPLSPSGPGGVETHWRSVIRDLYKEGVHGLVEKFAGRDLPPADGIGGAGGGKTKWPARNITYLHVGRAGGAALACSLREARKYGVRKRCGRTARAGFNDETYAESALSKRVNCYSHYNYNGKCLTDNKAFLINVRNPIDRLKSWYVQEHFLNEPITHPEFSENTLHCGALMLGTCYPDFDRLASIGLSGRREVDSRLEIHKELTPDECAHWAWSAVQGNIPASYHNAFNYEWYLRPLLVEEEHKTRPVIRKGIDVFVVRAEHLDEDWANLDRMLGGDGKTLPSDLLTSIVGSGVDERLFVQNSTLSDTGARNLCKALCREIQIYKVLIKQAPNLDEAAFNQSIAELRNYCPDEAYSTENEGKNALTCEYAGRMEKQF